MTYMDPIDFGFHHECCVFVDLRSMRVRLFTSKITHDPHLRKLNVKLLR